MTDRLASICTTGTRESLNSMGLNIYVLKLQYLSLLGKTFF